MIVFSSPRRTPGEYSLDESQAQKDNLNNTKTTLLFFFTSPCSSFKAVMKLDFKNGQFH